MKNIAFDTLDYSKRAQAAGIPQNAAEFHAHELAKLMEEELVTKSYLDYKLKDLTIKIGSMMLAGFTLTITILGFIIKFH